MSKFIKLKIRHGLNEAELLISVDNIKYVNRIGDAVGLTLRDDNNKYEVLEPSFAVLTRELKR